MAGRTTATACASRSSAPRRSRCRRSTRSSPTTTSASSSRSPIDRWAAGATRGAARRAHARTSWGWRSPNPRSCGATPPSTTRLAALDLDVAVTAAYGQILPQRCSTCRARASSTCTRACCRAGVARRPCSTRSSPATRPPACRSCRPKRGSTPDRCAWSASAPSRRTRTPRRCSRRWPTWAPRRSSRRSPCWPWGGSRAPRRTTRRPRWRRGSRATDGRIRWDEPARRVVDRHRGVAGWPGSWCLVGRRRRQGPRAGGRGRGRRTRYGARRGRRGRRGRLRRWGGAPHRGASRGQAAPVRPRLGQRRAGHEGGASCLRSHWSVGRTSASRACSTALLRRREALVDDFPGVTRDVKEGTVAFDSGRDLHAARHRRPVVGRSLGEGHQVQGRTRAAGRRPGAVLRRRPRGGARRRRGDRGLAARPRQAGLAGRHQARRPAPRGAGADLRGVRARLRRDPLHQRQPRPRHVRAPRGDRGGAPGAARGGRRRGSADPHRDRGAPERRQVEPAERAAWARSA